MSPASFHRLVDEELLPRGHAVKGMVIWDRYELDAAFESLKGDDNNRNTMHKLLGIKL